MAPPNWTERPQVLQLRRRSGVADLLVRSATNYRDHRTARNAALVAHFGFLSVFPLLLVFTTILGFVLQSHQSLRDRIIDSTFSQIPIIGPELARDPTQLQGDTSVLVVGLVVTLWAGMKAFTMLQNALDDIAEVPLDGRPNIVRSRARSLLGIALVGGGQVTAAVLAGLENGIHPSPSSTARRSARRELPPIQIGGCGCWAGRGFMV